MLPLAAALAQDQDGDGLPDGADACPSVPAPAPGGAFGPAEVLPGEPATRAVAADLDGDGRDELVGIASFGRSPGVAAWSRTRAGAWVGAPTAAGPFLGELAAADLDGDGRDEILGAGAWPDEAGVRIARNRRGALRPFDPLFPPSDRIGWARLAVADLDADGDPDLAQLLDYPGEGDFGALYGRERVLSWMENLGGGAFGVPRELLREPSGYPVESGLLRAGDIDGDGAIDLVVLGAPGWWLRGDGRGGFDVRPLAAPDSRVPLELADLDGDGAADVLAVRGRAGDLVVARGGPGGFGEPELVRAALEPSPRALSAADADEDGDLDLLLSTGSGLSWCEGDGVGFADPVPLAPGDGDFVASLDVDGDGARDLVTPGRRDAEMLVVPARHPGDGDRDGLCDPDDPCPTDPEEPCADADGDRRSDAEEAADGTDPARADTDGDGLDDGEDPAAHDRDADGVADRCDACPDGPDPTQGDGYVAGPRFDDAGAPAVGDLDGDGVPDLVVAVAAGMPEAGVRVAHGLGDRRFAPLARVPGIDAAAGAIVSDLDDDGVADLVIRDGVTWLRGRPGGGWDPPVALAPGLAPASLTPLRLDGRPAIAAAGHVFELVDAGGHATSLPAARSLVTAAGDVDGDGLDDLVVVETSGGLALFRQRPGGAFPEPEALLAEVPAGLALGDLDGDGDPDLALSTAAGVTWRENDGAGRFGPDRTVDAGAAPPLAAVDLDGDGDLDLAGLGSAGLLRWRRDGPGAFVALPYVAALGGTPTPVALGGGPADLVVVAASGNLRPPAVRVWWSDVVPDADGDGICDASDPPDPADPAPTGDTGDADPPARRRSGGGRCGCASGAPTPAPALLLAALVRRGRRTRAG